MKTVEKWGLLELTTTGRADGNPYLSLDIRADITHNGETRSLPGFYDGEGRCVARFMPEEEGLYGYRLRGEGVEEISGEFTVTSPGPGNHGPVRAAGTRLVYADGTPYHSVGTTCYAWTHQSEETQEQTLRSLKSSPFNKIRMCVFPKYYKYNTHEPVTYPYERGTQNGIDISKFSRLPGVDDITDFDCFRFDPAHFRSLDRRIAALAALGIEADIILFHPYDKWGFSIMTREANDLYLRYMAARYGAYRNIWWSMANEYDLTDKNEADWEHYGRLITSLDPYSHLCSVHNCVNFYDYRRDWITHCSMQRNDWYLHVQKTDEHAAFYGKPVVWDEICYEGNIDLGWGNISGQEMVFRFWEAVLRGGYAGHGETFVCPEERLWWAHGGVLRGESAPRLMFLKKIWDEVPGGALKKVRGCFDELVSIPAHLHRADDWSHSDPAAYELHYYGIGRPSFRQFRLGEGTYQIEVIDTWNMTVTDLGPHTGDASIPLPAANGWRCACGGFNTTTLTRLSGYAIME